MSTNKLISAIALATASSTVFGSGFQVNEHSASGLGRAFAGEGAIGDNASVLARNPAAMALFDSTALSVGISYVDPSFSIEGTVNGAIPAVEENAIPNAWVPNAHIIMPLSNKWAVGLSMNTNFGMMSDYNSSFAATDSADIADVATYQFNPNLSYRVNDTVSVGAGINILYGHGEFGVTAPQWMSGSAHPLEGLAGLELLNMQGDGFALGWNIGTLIELSAHTRIGLSYRSAIDLELSGDVSTEIPAMLQPLVSIYEGAGSLDLNMPEIAEISFYHDLQNGLEISAGWMWTGWSSFETLVAEYENPEYKDILLADNYWDNTNRYSVAAEYQIDANLKVRAGLALDESPVSDEYRNLSIPDTDRTWYTAGLTWDLDKVSSIDFGYALINGSMETINYTSKLGNVFNGEITQADAHIFSISYNRSL